MRKISLLLAVIFAGIFNSSCKDEEVEPQDLEGSWVLKSTQLTAKFTGKDEVKNSEDLSSRNLFLNLDAAGSFQSNSLFSLELEDPLAEQSISGTYELKDGFLIFKYKDPDPKSGEDISFFMKASSSSKSLNLTVDKECLTKTIEATDAEAAFILLAIEKYDLKLSYSKK